MATRLITLDFRKRKEWRQWLLKNHAWSPGAWLVRHKQHTGVLSMPYEELVCEALCFGWVDSLVKRLDNEFFQQLARTYRRDFVVWTHIAERPETREKRIRESIALLAAGKKLGLK
ncbi:MAG TPA: YdeI/OmpD-associated family protein [Gemmatimonadales bacterium]|nr:YdeI/OmpD-associated family protein [Gemmatimonadales bacterium]